VKTDKITVVDLFDRPRRYLIPLFQRGYVWTEQDQWAPLWEDITDQIEAVRHARETDETAIRKHFLGAIVLQQQTLGVRRVPVSDVIDGQQRLTTLQIILIALRDAVAPLKNDFLTSTLQRLTDNPAPYVDEAERFKVWPTSSLQDDLAKIATAASAKRLEELYPLRRERRKWLPRPSLVRAYLFFANAIRQSIGIDTEPTLDAETLAKAQERAEELLETITRYIQLVEIDLDPEDDPQIIFETLNARGVALSPSDLIRNLLFLIATRRNENVPQLYERYWKPFDETPDLSPKSKTRLWWREEERQGRLRVNRLDLFFFHYLTFRTETELKLGHIFPAFRDWWESQLRAESHTSALDSLTSSAGVFRRLLSGEPETTLGVVGDRLKALDVSTVYPLVLFLAEQEVSLPASEFGGILTDLESYLVRRLVCGLTTKAYNRVFLSILKQLRSGGAASRGVLQKILTALEGESSAWPEDRQFEQAFLMRGAYKHIRASRAKMILLALEGAMATSRQEQVQVGGPISVEHVWPQSPGAGDWPGLPTTSDGSVDYAAAARQTELVESFGNLTLVTPAFNSTLSNAPYAEKQPELIRESRLQLNAYFQDIPAAHGWGEEDILQRGRSLFELARTVWPYPD
jgi:Protein of unknown function DUF262/Protein of unknown function (DUF1524)